MGATPVSDQDDTACNDTLWPPRPGITPHDPVPWPALHTGMKQTEKAARSRTVPKIVNIRPPGKSPVMPAGGSRMKTIALTMIVKNEARSLARCLDSVAPWVDKMIVLDTGSTDDTIAIARAHGAEVYERRWTNDFAAARNAALAHSDADWNLVLDADEWLTSGGEYLQALRHDSRRAVHNIRIDSDLGNGSNILISSHRIPRILPQGVHYVGRIHEQPAHNLPVVDASVAVRHDGYMQAQLDTKKGRNLALLEETLAEMPDDPYMHFQLGKQYDIEQQHDKALSFYHRARELVRNRSPWYHDLVVRTIECLRHEGRLEEAMIFASDEMPYWDQSPDFYFVVGCLLLDQMQKRPEQGKSLLPMIEESWLKALAIGERPDLAGNVIGRGSFMAAGQLWALFDARKEVEKAAHYNDMQKKLYAQYKEAADAGLVSAPALPEQQSA